MKIRKLNCLLLFVVAAFSLFSCINDEYDLSDIDTTVGLKVNDITIPLNLDEVTLKSVLDLEEDSPIKTVNGEYAVVEDGEFSSDGIEIPSFTINAPAIEPISETLVPDVHFSSADFPEWMPMAGVGFPADKKIVSFDLKDVETSFDIESDVDEAIVGVDAIGVVTTLRFNFNVDGMEHLANTFDLEELVIQLPKGLEAQPTKGVYSQETGKLTIGKLTSDEGMEVALDILITKIHAEPAGAKLENGHFSFSNVFSVTGTVALYGHNLKEDVDLKDLFNLGTIGYECALGFPEGDIEVANVTGDIQYQVDGINVDPVSLDDMPDFLSQEGTDIRLVNPQIYLELNNPVYEQYQVYATSGLEFIPNPDTTGEQFKVDVMIDEAVNRFCMSPSQPDTYYKNAGNDLLTIDFAGAEYVPFANLGNILSGDSIPDSIGINILDPQIPRQHVENFALGQTLGAIKGTYVFYAPLALAEGSVIKYSETFDEWSDDEIDNIEISQMKVNAKIQSDVPFDLVLKAYPIDKSGNKIMDNGQVVVGKAYMEGSTSELIPANASGSIIIEINGTVRHLDGIILDAEIHGKDASGSTGNSLKPDHHVKLDDIRINVSGEYTTEL